MPKCGKPHTPIVSEAQRGKFGAELGRRRAGKKSGMKGITTKELESHLHESKGKELPERTTPKKRLSKKQREARGKMRKALGKE